MNEFNHWNLLVFDPSDPDDPRWLLATVSTVTAVRRADVDDTGKRYTDWRGVSRWVRSVLGRAEVSLYPVDEARVWRVDGPR